jgi:hypothetical protein
MEEVNRQEKNVGSQQRGLMPNWASSTCPEGEEGRREVEIELPAKEEPRRWPTSVGGSQRPPLDELPLVRQFQAFDGPGAVLDSSQL